jgi:hypothetical protein
MADSQKPEKTGKFLGIPYDWRRPTWERFKKRVWNPNDRRVITPRYFGWGWDINFHELAARLHLVKRP